MNTPTKKESIVFSFAWLANVNANVGKKRESDLKQNAVDGINGGLKDLKSFTGDFGSKPIWGPATLNEVGDDDEFITDNLLYAVKGPDPDDSTKTVYVIATSGTNPSSYYGWFSEDFNVSTQVGFLGAKVSQGTFNGISVLNTLKDDSNQYIAAFLQDALKNEKDRSKVEVIVTGHSLGGTLCPVLALELKNTLGLLYPDVTFSAYPFAGASPGDEDFTNFFNNAFPSENFHSWVNDKDVVPRGWIRSLLSDIPSLYTSMNGFQDCDGNTSIPENTIVEGITQWVIGQIPASDPYVRLGTDNHFTTKSDYPITGDTCTKIGEAADVIFYAPSDLSVLHKYVKGIYDAMNGSPDKWNLQTVKEFLYFMAEAGIQHTRGYLDFMLEEQGYGDAKTALQKYVANTKPDDAVNDDLKDNLKEFLYMVYSYLNPNG